MKSLIFHFGCIAFLCLLAGIHSSKLIIETTKKVECTTKTKNGDSLRIHYTGSLEDGSEFDSSYRRGHPFSFTIGIGHVIKGWDQGLLNMCPGEKRKLTIPSELGYGDAGFGDLIKPGSTLIFDTELIKIEKRKTEL